MREHGILKRVLLIYEEAIRRITAREDLAAEALVDSAKIIREFIEDYHEKLEEDYLFPRFEKARKQVELVKVLREQHQAGRRVTDLTMSLLKGGVPNDAADRGRVADALRQFVRMYEPHEAREDTVFFPPSGRSSRNMNTTRSARTSRRRNTIYSAKTASRKWSIKLPALKRSLASTNWRSLPPKV